MNAQAHTYGATTRCKPESDADGRLICRMAHRNETVDPKYLIDESEPETAPRIPVRNPDQPTYDAIDELQALAGYRTEYVTEATRKTVRRVTGLDIRQDERWTPTDRIIALDALRESVLKAV